MIFFEDFENRIAAWLAFRQELENHSEPLQRVIDFWNKAPISSRTCDPFDQSTWLKPWDLIEDNHFCEFSKILAIYYTLVLTDRFKDSYFEIQVVNDREAHEIRYLLFVDDYVIGYFYNRAIMQDELPMDLNIQASYPMLMDYS
jgi:hypothetical protein